MWVSCMPGRVLVQALDPTPFLVDSTESRERAVLDAASGIRADS